MNFLDFLYKNILESFTEKVGGCPLIVLQMIMWVIGGILIYLAIKKDMEPTLLLPMGFGAILVNLPGSGAIGAHGPLTVLFNAGIANELFPLLLFIGIGAMIDFAPILQNPKLMLFGAASQFGIFMTMLLASFFFDIEHAATIGIIGAADGPTAIFVGNTLLGAGDPIMSAVMVAAYSYMALVPIIQPPVIKLLTTKKERCIRMQYKGTDDRRLELIIIIPGYGKENEIVDIEGPLCMTEDKISWDEPIEHASIGDIIVLTQSGAYCYSASTLWFLSHKLPMELII